ncbi:MAG: response regulator [Bryobacteraceae bacterium]|nr:response regulator [Bryobacteraceae bacterium]
MKVTVPPSISPSPEETFETHKRPVHILIAEDNAGDVLLIQEALQFEKLDSKLIVHTDGEQMLRYIERIDAGEISCPDIVLLDLNLPKKNGHVLLERMKQSLVCGHVPVVIVTSSNSPADRQTAARLGVTEYLRKPSDFDEFMRLGALVRKLTR